MLADRNAAVAQTLQLSLKRLTAAEQALYKNLAVFPEDEPIPLPVAAQLWGLGGSNSRRLAVKLATASLRVHDLRGALVEELDLGLRGAGRHEVVWDATRFSSGVYFLTLQAGEDAATRKAVLMK